MISLSTNIKQLF